MGVCTTSKAGTPETYTKSATANTQAVVGGLPELQGSAKQVEWGNNLRSNYVENFNNAVNGEMIYGRSPWGIQYNELTPERIEKVEAIKELRTESIGLLKEVTSASEIIDMRNSFSSQNIRRVAGEIVKNKSALSKLSSSGRKKGIRNLAIMGLGFDMQKHKLATRDEIMK